MKLALVATNAKPFFEGQPGADLLVAVIELGQSLVRGVPIGVAPSAALGAGGGDELLVEPGQLTDLDLSQSYIQAQQVLPEGAGAGHGRLDAGASQ